MATNTPQNMQYLLLFNCNSDFANTPLCYVVHILSVLLNVKAGGTASNQQYLKVNKHFIISFCEMFPCCSIHDQNTERAAYKEVKMFYGALQQQMMRVFQFNVASGQLVRIKTPLLTITNETKLRAQTGGILNDVLRFLYEGSVKIDTCTPTLGVHLN